MTDEQRGVTDEAELRGRLYGELDRLAFALELEAAEAVERGDEDGALRLTEQRLGVRLAQRLVGGVHADEVDERVRRTRDAYDARVRGEAPPVAVTRP